MDQIENVATAAISPPLFDLQRDNEFKAALLGMAGHDLRQPLQVIQSTYDLLASSATTPSERERLKRGERALVRITEQLDRLLGALHLHEQMRDIEVARIAPGPLLLKLAKDCADQAMQRRIELRVYPSSQSVMSNPVLLDGILRNLVQNTIKYTQPGGRILIGCRRFCTATRIDVIDNGIGIPTGHMQRIFLALSNAWMPRKRTGSVLAYTSQDALRHCLAMAWTPAPQVLEVHASPSLSRPAWRRPQSLACQVIW